MTSLGDSAQVRMIVEQVAEATIAKFEQANPRHNPGVDIPAPLKWASGIIAALMTAALIGMAFWMVTTLSDLQQTVTRIDERQKLTGDSMTQRIEQNTQRITALEVLTRVSTKP